MRQTGRLTKLPFSGARVIAEVSEQFPPATRALKRFGLAAIPEHQNRRGRVSLPALWKAFISPTNSGSRPISAWHRQEMRAEQFSRRP
jgi:hypothetical protein